MRWRVGPPHQISSLLTNLDTPSQLQPRRNRVLLFVGANEKSDWNFSLKIKPKEMGEAPEGGWIQSQYQTAPQPAAVPKSCFQVSRSWMWPFSHSLDFEGISEPDCSSSPADTRRITPAQQQEKGKTKGAGGGEVITSDVTAAGWFVRPDTTGWASRAEIPPKINSWAWGHRSGSP